MPKGAGKITRFLHREKIAGMGPEKPPYSPSCRSPAGSLLEELGSLVEVVSLEELVSLAELVSLVVLAVELVSLEELALEASPPVRSWLYSSRVTSWTVAYSAET